MLHRYDTKLPAFAQAVERTKKVIYEGLRIISRDAGEAFIFDTQANRKTIEDECADVVNYAVRLMDAIKSCFFSASLTLSWVPPQTPFDENIMDQEDGGSSEVRCTISLGLNEISPLGDVRVVMKPKVILSET